MFLLLRNCSLIAAMIFSLTDFFFPAQKSTFFRWVLVMRAPKRVFKVRGVLSEVEAMKLQMAIIRLLATVGRSDFLWPLATFLPKNLPATNSEENQGSHKSTCRTIAYLRVFSFSSIQIIFAQACFCSIFQAFPLQF